VSPRKPPELSFESWIEQQIQQGQRDGLFDALPGKGQPQKTDDAGDPLWWAKGLLRREQLDALPPALAIRRAVERAIEALPTIPNEARVRELLGKLDREIRHMNATSTGGPATTQAPLDIEALVADWRRAREERSESRTARKEPNEP
jgi:hypothetical protein